VSDKERFVYPFWYTDKRYLVNENAYALYRLITFGTAITVLFVLFFLKDYKFGFLIAAMLILSMLIARLVLARSNHKHIGASVPGATPRHVVGGLTAPIGIKIGTLFLSGMLLISLYQTISTGHGIAGYQIAIGVVVLIGAFRWWGGG
jgi:hypothetical protein